MDLQFRTQAPDGRTWTYPSQERALEVARALVAEGFAPITVVIGDFLEDGHWQLIRQVASTGWDVAARLEAERQAALAAVEEREAARRVDVLEAFADVAHPWAEETDRLGLDVDGESDWMLRRMLPEGDDGLSVHTADLGLSHGDADGGYERGEYEASTRRALARVTRPRRPRAA